MSETPKETVPKAPKATKRERAYDLAVARYSGRQQRKGWPYVLHGDQRYNFGSRDDRQSLRADLRKAWREEYGGNPPGDSDLNSVIDDLRVLALAVEPDPPDENGHDASWGGGDDDETPADRGLSRVTAHDDHPLPDGYEIPDGYEVRPDGIWYLAGRWGPCRAAWAWLFPVRVYIDPDGNQSLELAWRDCGRWVTRLVRRSITKSGRRLILETGDAGLPITDSEARDAEQWLAAAEAANLTVIARHPVARQLGWQSDGTTFVTGQDSPWRVEPAYPGQAAPLAAHRPMGTLEGWQQAMEHARDYPIVQASTYAGLTPPLLNVLGLSSFTFDMSGNSSRGKSTAGAAGLAPWADPSDLGGGLIRWNTTTFQAEVRLNLANGVPVVIDETRLVSNPQEADAIIYMIPTNYGKPRGAGFANRIPWRTVVISTGEKPLTSFAHDQGASARVLSTNWPPFGPKSDKGRTACEAVKRGFEANYGVAGPLFVMRLKEQLSEPGGAAGLREQHAALTEGLRGTTGMSGRRAPMLAAIVLAAQLAAKWEITPLKVPANTEWLAMFAAADPRDNRPEMALDIIREFIAAHQDKLYDRKVERDYKGNEVTVQPGPGPASGWIGHTADEGPALFPQKVHDELKRCGYDFEAVLGGWLEMGALVTKPTKAGRRQPYMIPRRTGGKPPVGHLIFRREVIYPESDDE